MKEEFVEFLDIRYSIETWKISEQDLLNNIILDVLPRILLDLLGEYNLWIAAIVDILKEVFVQFVDIKCAVWTD